jgi:predicted nucleotidyltransferase
MTETERLSSIRNTIAATLKENSMEVVNIYLFGSRARGAARTDSDYDIMVVTQKDLDGKQKFNLLRKIRKKIKYLGLGIDVVLNSAAEYNDARNLFGSLVHSIRNEIIPI